MNIGIMFKIPNEYGNYLKQILNGIDSNNYIWKIKEDEIYINGDNNLFETKKYTNDEFKNIISQDNYYTIFANIELYEIEDKIAINNYADFLKSSCILILLITDNEFVEVYSKNIDILTAIYRNALNNDFCDIKYITKESLERKKFSAYSD